MEHSMQCDIGNGVKQGGCLSPTLFCVYLNESHVKNWERYANDHDIIFNAKSVNYCIIVLTDMTFLALLFYHYKMARRYGL